MKNFYYNSLVSKEDFADREEDIKNLLGFILTNKKIVLFAPRRYGKSSLSKNILPALFSGKTSKKKLVFYFDFMDCDSYESFIKRISKGVSEGLSKYLPPQSLFKNLKDIIKSLTLQIDQNSFSGQVGVTIGIGKNGIQPSLEHLIKLILNLSKKYHSLLIFDEFQDIASIKEVMALLRGGLQELKATPILFLGSKRKLLSQIFSNNNSPFFNFADEYILKPIPTKDWIPFFKERLGPLSVEVTPSAIERIAYEAFDVPNTICEIGAFIQQKRKNIKIDETRVGSLLMELLEQKNENFRYQLSLLSQNEKKLLLAISQNRYTQEILGKKMLQATELSSSGLRKVFKRLLNLGLIEEETSGFRISNPLLGLFLVHRPL